MKEIKKIKSEIKQQAYQNIEGFDITKLCYKTIYEIMQKAILKCIDETTDFNIVYNDQIDLYEFRYGFVKEKNQKAYPCVDLMVDFQDEITKENYLFRVRMSPFNCEFNKWNNPSKEFNSCDEKLTHCWHIILKGLFKDNWVSAYKNYLLDLKCLKESKIATRVEKQYLKLEQEYENEINSI